MCRQNLSDIPSVFFRQLIAYAFLLNKCITNKTIHFSTSIFLIILHFLEFNFSEPRGQIQSRELPKPPGVRPPMPTPHDTPPMPERPPKPKPSELKNVNGNNLTPPLIPSRPPAKSPVQRTQVLPPPVTLNQRKISPSEETRPPAGQSHEDHNRHPQSDLGDRKHSGGSSVSDLKQKFSNTNSSSDSSHVPLRPKPNMGPKPFSSQPHQSVERPMPDLPTPSRLRGPSASSGTPPIPTPTKPSSRKWNQESDKQLKPPPIPTPTKPSLVEPPRCK